MSGAKRSALVKILGGGNLRGEALGGKLEEVKGESVEVMGG